MFEVASPTWWLFFSLWHLQICCLKFSTKSLFVSQQSFSGSQKLLLLVFGLFCRGWQAPLLVQRTMGMLQRCAAYGTDVDSP